MVANKLTWIRLPLSEHPIILPHKEPDAKPITSFEYYISDVWLANEYVIKRSHRVQEII